ncbi:NAD(P)-dependent alcohol dehydrogenase [Microbacterium sp. cx-55]|uniref:NAD(P)-dependent alcohol dehydrogenase n=1 Tax=Microbacterium sp. cx-55 TaxID=2875948 RepID=UPI001CBDABDB|nr:NAD(P)-dependent alcohol dehydrogenase [Microbacterium sp. cx-55]MBZ4488368.1 NAD(P)-dependent alcohol dehydrogenase [Microbacterium sp. cx-55]UGB35021.1 NAD(P)-dependent alcohol dehydrogenase [Microbacterium sp. cx-55]
MTAGRAAVLENGALTVADVEYGRPGHGEVRVRLVASGLCHTDLGVIAGGIPFPSPGVIGHEGGGIVDEVGAGVTQITVGDKVLLSFTSCGACAGCDTGHPAYCETWQPRNLFGLLRGEDSGVITRDGAPISGHFFGQSSFGTYAIADERSLVKVGADADLAVLAPLGCGVLTGFGSMWNVLDPGTSDTVAVYGTGAVGLSAVMAAADRHPAAIVAIDLVDERLALARRLGATHTINPGTENVAERLAEITGGHGIDLSFDTTANPRVARGALDAAAIRGTVLVCGAPPPGTEILVDIQGILTGKVLRGVTMGDTVPQELIPRLAALHAEGRLPLEELEKTYALDDIDQAVADMHHGVTVKPVIVY